MPYADITDGCLYYEEYGRGEPLLLIPGLGGVGSFWNRQIDRLSDRFRVIIHDHRGTGRSETTTAEGYSIRLLADDVLALMDHLELQCAAIVGHSTGGVIGQTLAAFTPQRVSRLVLSSSWAKGDAYFDSLFGLRLEVLETAGIDAYERFGRLLRYAPTYFETHPEALLPPADGSSGTPEVIAARIRAILDFDSRNFLRDIVSPTLIIGALDDAITPPHLWRALEQGIANSRRVELPYGGHFCPQSRHKDYNRHLLEFLNACATGDTITSHRRCSHVEED